MFPSQERLARLCSLSERSVITQLQIAESMGWIKSQIRHIEGKQWSAKCYFATWPDEVKEVHPIADGVKEVQVRGEGGSPNGVKEVHTNSPLEYSNELSNTPKPPKGGSECFEKFWAAYPPIRKKDKPQCIEVWKRKKLDAQIDSVMAGLEAWKASQDWKKEEGRFIKGPLPWLRGEYWTTPPATPLKKVSDPFAPNYNPLANVSW